MKIIKKNIKKLDFINSNKYFNEALSIPLYPSLTFRNQNYIIKSIIDIIKINRKT